MLAAVEIPLPPQPQRLAVQLSGVRYHLKLYWCSVDQCWAIDLLDHNGVQLVGGISLVPKYNLLAPYRHLGIPGRLLVINTAQPDLPPDWFGLGTTGKLYYIPDVSPT